jgi:phosphoribosyl-AMP cyclohydrolase / phosphoribosyl-ATP pyrophosphohydrolase
VNAPSPSAELDLERLDWDKNGGLLPAIVQHADNGSVLMLGYMNREALRATLERGRVVFYSRRRQELWEKGATSGHYLELVDVHTDCDRDTLLVSARPHGPACHRGTATCFGEEPLSDAERVAFLAALGRIIGARRNARPEESYTARLLGQGPKRVAQKVGEEGLEVALAGVAEDDAALIGEAADLLFHLLVLLESRHIALERVVEELEMRHGSR